MAVKILWAGDNFGGPYNGMCLYEGQKLWFQQSHTDTEGKKFLLLKLDDVITDLLQMDHEDYCRLTGAPIYHGAPRRMKRATVVKKSNLVPAGEESTEVSLRGLGQTIKYDRRVNPLDVKGDLIKILTQDDFENYFVPQMIEFTD